MMSTTEARVLEAVRKRGYVRLTADGEADPGDVSALATDAALEDRQVRKALRDLLARGELRHETLRLLDVAVESPAWLLPAGGGR